MFKNILIILVSVFLLVISIGFFLPPSGCIRPESTIIEDNCNLLQDLSAAISYKDDKGHFPERFSTLLNNEDLPMPTDSQGLLNSRRFSSNKYEAYKGPFPNIFSNHPDNYPPERFIATPFDADINCDYLYLKPLPGYTPQTIIMMTRPGVLYQNKIHVGYANGNVKLLDAKTWQRRSDVLSFLGRWIKQRDDNLNRYSNSKWIFPDSKFPDFFREKTAPDWDKRYHELVEGYKKKFVPPPIGLKTTFYRKGYSGLYAKLAGVKEKYAEIEFQGRISRWDVSEFRKDFKLKLFEAEFAKERANAALLREKAQYECFLKQKTQTKRSGKGIDIDYYVYRKNGEIHITGTIINNSNKPLGHVPAKINLYTEDGGHIESYEKKNILSSEVSLKKVNSFHIKEPDVPQAVKVYVEFSSK